MGSRIKENPEKAFEVYAEVTHPESSNSGDLVDACAVFVTNLIPDDFSQPCMKTNGVRHCLTLRTRRHFQILRCGGNSLRTTATSLTVSQVGQNFTFVLTDIDSKQRFGFCRLSSGAKTCFCILSYLPWFEVFYKLLNILAEYTATGQGCPWKELLETLYNLPLPEPGSTVHLSVHSYFTTPDTRELPSIPENRNLTEYFVAVDVNNMLHLYASMLYERRVLISCSKLSTLTACIHGSAAMLYPMFWQHVYIPVLPPHLLDYCCAPMPYLIGVHSSLMEKVRNMALEDVVILNVDNNTLETPFDDLQSLPNDVLSTLKNRLKKVSTTTGDGVARAFLKTQAALFGSYRNALKIEPEEPITFNEDVFVSHRSSAMRQFLQNAIQLQLFKQFIDGRLDLLNSGEGFSDMFEEEINNGEYAGGSDKSYHQWLFTVKKGSGAIINTMKTKANPAMKTVYKFAKDHAKMGIKEVKNRLKQKEMAENGYSVAGDDIHQKSITSPLSEKKEGKQREDRQPITVHFGQARPPRPPVKKPRSNALPVEARISSISSPEHIVRPTRHYTVFLSEDSSDDELHHEEDSISAFSESFLFTPFEWPQPYKTLKESDIIDGEVLSTEKRHGSTIFPSLSVPGRNMDVNLLDDIFSSIKVTSKHQPLSQAKSMEDLRTPKEEEIENPFGHQWKVMMSAEKSKTKSVGLHHTLPHTKLRSMGQDDMALNIKSINGSSPGSIHFGSFFTEIGAEALNRDGSLPTSDIIASGQGSITIPRPHGRKSTEKGIVLPPPVAVSRGVKQQVFPGVNQVSAVLQDSSKQDTTVSSTGSVSEMLQESTGTEKKPQAPDLRQSLNSSPQPLLSSRAVDILKPIKVSVEMDSRNDLLSLLDPLSAASSLDRSQSPVSKCSLAPAPSLSSTPAPTGFVARGTDLGISTPPASLQFSQTLGYSTPSPAPIAQFPQPPSYPFSQTMPAALQFPPTQPSASHFAPPAASAFVSSFLPSNSGFFQPQMPHRNYSAPSLHHLYSQPLAIPQSGTFIQKSAISASLGGISYPKTAGKAGTTVAESSAEAGGATKNLTEPPLVPPKPSKGLERILPSNPGEAQDPFADLLNATKKEPAPSQSRVDQLRRKWETFE
ncbi:DENN domain-containing protein 1A-like isoform X3 [Carcharodon carcharias]|uniref:DENN domain-containing protein 1A-like isoform X3 n=1 Tax=Carcharodon carcharias TaxID=13397 RepID=UPI001B7F4A34|nr:DENN domain-containing protein 1A-like isoform X3 [Carcharodon carcharias]